MKQFSEMVLKILIISVVLISPSLSAFADEEISFIAVENIVPFSYEEEGKIKGIDYEFILEISKRVGFNPKIMLLPFKRGLHLLETGEVDGSFQIYYKEDRESFLIYSEIPIHYSNVSIYVKKDDNFIFNKIEDLYGKKVGIQSGFFISPEFQKAVDEQKIVVDEAKECEMNLKKLAAGRIDCFISSPQIAMFYINNLGFQEKIKSLPNFVVPEKGTYLALSKNGKNIKDKDDFIKKINAAMKEIIADGTYDKIQNKYLK